MDIDFIGQLYYGNINPSHRSLYEKSQLGRACKTFGAAEDTLTAALTGAEKDTLIALLNAHGEIVGTSDYESFCRGFRLGALAIMDIFQSNEQLFEED